MKLTGELKKQVEKAGSKDEKKSLIENAGMLLRDDELEMVSGGKHHDGTTHGNCPDGAIEMKWNLDHFPSDRKTKHGCPLCGGNMRDQKFWFEQRLYNGFICERDDSHRWKYGNPI